MASLIDNKNLDDETALWAGLAPSDWKNSICGDDSVFKDLYIDTRRRIIDIAQDFDCIMEVGCGTGEVLATLGRSGLPRIGVDINKEFIDHCAESYGDQENVSWHVGDATDLTTFWSDCGFDKKYKKPLVICPNNTLMIMPESIREIVVKEMRRVAGENGRIMITFWNGKLFAHGVLGY